MYCFPDIYKIVYQIQTNKALENIDYAGFKLDNDSFTLNKIRIELTVSN